MLSTYVTALAGMIIISCSWLAVQRLWQRHFPEQGSGAGDDDALAGRSGCHACNCAPAHCEREADGATPASLPHSSPHPSPQPREAT